MTERFYTMKKNIEMNKIIKSWRNFNNESLLSERVFYGSGENYVITTSDYEDYGKAYVIYDDYSELLGEPTNFGFDGIRCLSKDAVKEGESVEDWILVMMEEIFGRYSRNENYKNKVENRIRTYKEEYPEIFSDDNLIIFNPFAKSYGDPYSMVQKPIVKDELSGSRVNYKLSPEEISGEDSFNFKKSDFPDRYSEEEDEDYYDEKVFDRGSLSTNINWTIHDLGHVIMDDIQGEDAEFDYEEKGDFEDLPAYRRIYGNNYSHRRKLDKIYMLLSDIDVDDYKRRIYFDLTELIDNIEMTPGVGPNDQEYSFFAKILKDTSEDKINSIISQIIKYCDSNIDKLNPKIVKYFKLQKNNNMLRNFLNDVFKIKIDITKRFFENIKIVLITL